MTRDVAEARNVTNDPVCGMAIDPRRAAETAVHDGRMYYFCSARCRERFVARPDDFAPKVTAMRLTVGVMGSAGAQQVRTVLDAAFQLGESIARRGFVLITGACPGLPHACARGARRAGGLSIGISPALSLDEHVNKYLSPSDAFDVIVYTGSGLMGREVTNIRSSDMVIIVGGRSGTLGEFAIAYDEGKLIGVLRESGGITGHIEEIVRSFGGKDTGARLVYDADPKALVDRLAEEYAGTHFRRPSCFCAETYGNGAQG